MKNFFLYISFFILTINLCSCGKLHKFNDTITLDRTDKIPYGTYVAYQLLQKEFPNARIETNRYAPAYWQNLTSDSTKQVLIIVTKTFEPSEEDLDYLTGFVQKGNYVFISALQYTRNAVKFFHIKSNKHFNYYGLALGVHGPFNPFDSVGVKLDSSAFEAPLSWSYPGVDFANEFSNTDSALAFHLGYSSDSLPNLIAINAIDGTFFIHSAPFTFSNFFLLYGNNRQYFEKLMHLFPDDTKKIVWDEYYLHHYDNQNTQQKQGILSVILKYENFRWAFWVTLLLLSLYLVTETKRKQRIIPVHAKPKNDSLEFVTTIGELYYEKGDHKNLADKLTQYFLDHVRNRYKIATTEINNTFAQQLAIKSGKPVDDIQQLIDTIHVVNLSNNITQKQLLDYYALLEKFYTAV